MYVGDGVAMYGILSLFADLDIQNNVLYFEGDKISTVGFYMVAIEGTNYSDIKTQNITDNIMYVSALTDPTCVNVGFFEATDGTDPNLANWVSPEGISGNDIFFDSVCTQTALYIDDKVGSHDIILDIDDLNNKIGFAVDDPTVFSDNIIDNPLFEDPANGDFDLLEGSPML